MVKNITGGNKAKKGKRCRLTKNPMNEFDTGNGIYFYGQVKGKLGGNTLEVLLQTGETVHATIPGRFMRRVWFNKDDLIVVLNETGNFYDVIQKVTKPSIQIQAMNALNIKLDKDDSQIFRADDKEFEQDDEDEDDEKTEISKAELNAMRKKKDKEKDLERRNEDKEERIISVVTENDSNDYESDSENESPKSSSSSSTSSSQKKKDELETESESESEEELEDSSPIELPNVVESRKKNISKTVQPVQTVQPKKSVQPKKTVQPVQTVKPVNDKVTHYQETSEEIVNMLGL